MGSIGVGWTHGKDDGHEVPSDLLGLPLQSLSLLTGRCMAVLLISLGSGKALWALVRRHLSKVGRA